MPEEPILKASSPKLKQTELIINGSPTVLCLLDSHPLELEVFQVPLRCWYPLTHTTGAAPSFEVPASPGDPTWVPFLFFHLT